MNISLPSELEIWVKEHVASGEYASPDALILDAIRRLRDDLDPVLPGRPFTPDELRTLIQKRLDGRPGKPLDIEAILDEADRLRESRRKTNHG